MKALGIGPANRGERRQHPAAELAPPTWPPRSIARSTATARSRFAVRTPGGCSWGWHQTQIFPSASVLKAMLLVAYLDLASVQNRPLRPPDRALIAPMIHGC